jgi:hypothetical protein
VQSTYPTAVGRQRRRAEMMAPVLSAKKMTSESIKKIAAWGVEPHLGPMTPREQATPIGA